MRRWCRDPGQEDATSGHNQTFCKAPRIPQNITLGRRVQRFSLIEGHLEQYQSNFQDQSNSDIFSLAASFPLKTRSPPPLIHLWSVSLWCDNVDWGLGSINWIMAHIGVTSGLMKTSGRRGFVVCRPCQHSVTRTRGIDFKLVSLSSFSSAHMLMMRWNLPFMRKLFPRPY